MNGPRLRHNNFHFVLLEFIGLEDVLMFFLTTLNFSLEVSRGDAKPFEHDGNGSSQFPDGQLSSTAWEGWWHEDTA